MFNQKIQPQSDFSFADIVGLEDGSPLSASVSLLLAAGGDKRIWPDPQTGRNRYGTKPSPSDEISFASTTANNVSDEGFKIAQATLQRLIDVRSPAPIAIDQWFAGLRDAILDSLGRPDAQLILSASGTDAELLAACLIAGISKRPLTNILIAPDETGSGVVMAAGGRHFSDLTALGSDVEAGRLVEGLAAERIRTRSIAIRAENGQPRQKSDIDADLLSATREELRQGNDVLLHVLDTSKTGLSGVTREAAREAAAMAPGRVHVLVDACQFRCSLAQVRQDIADGFAVAMTGSKFLAGPPFSGALLIPTLTAHSYAAANIPAGLQHYTAAHDWPADLRNRMSAGFGSAFNLGLGLRWAATLPNLVHHAEVAEFRQTLIREQFVALVRSRISALPGAVLHANDDGDHVKASAIVPLTFIEENGACASFERTRDIQLLMRDLADGPVCHIGQAVRLGERTVLRVSASAIDQWAVAERLSQGESLQQASRALEPKLDRFFEKLSIVLDHVRAV